ncbi:MAG: HNH endonuclease [bacterium]|nr:HNH endonuclease [bacterium]
MDGLKMRLLIERGDTCQRCSFSNTELLIIHHVDRDRTHNDLTNLELICPNCHAAEHYLGKSWIKRYNVEQYRNKLLL